MTSTMEQQPPAANNLTSTFSITPTSPSPAAFSTPANLPPLPPSHVKASFNPITYKIVLHNESDKDKANPFYVVDWRWIKHPPVVVRARSGPAADSLVTVATGTLHPVSIHARYRIMGRPRDAAEAAMDDKERRERYPSEYLRGLSHFKSQYGYLSYLFTSGAAGDAGKMSEWKQDFAAPATDTQGKGYESDSDDAQSTMSKAKSTASSSRFSSATEKGTPMSWKAVHTGLKTWEFVLLHEATQQAVARFAINLFGGKGGKFEFDYEAIARHSRVLSQSSSSSSSAAQNQVVEAEAMAALVDEIVTTGFLTFHTILFRASNIFSLAGGVFAKTGLSREQAIEEQKREELRDMERGGRGL